ncbi:hypothetical protein VRRI112168_09125 [Vreelandella rituensis]|uniref:Uncharacterized protein n=1 Tax=Vreelandella rituensis TaxID=2282306 RepID=A0A368U7E6_9GAMM|nr:hypothetical protein [Halomonas rituensis]RCV92032.1 hypothetical protein DU506_09705 [Halomonas rituensis]
MKSTKQRDLYAEALVLYRHEVPVEQWPIYRGAVSRSGLERALKARGLERFERKRLESSKCRPILSEMDAAVQAWVTQLSQPAPSAQESAESAKSGAAEAQEVRRLQRRVEQLEKDLEKARQRERRQRERFALLEVEVEEVRRQRGAFEKHCHSSLRTLHV